MFAICIAFISISSATANHNHNDVNSINDHIAVDERDPNADYDPRVIGGIPIAWPDVPYIVSIRYNGLHICGGAILNVAQGIILTDSHCFDSAENADEFTVAIGCSRTDCSDGTEEIRISYITSAETIAPNGNVKNDIAIAFLGTPITDATAVDALLATARPSSSAPLTLLGYGATCNTTGCTSTGTLQKASSQVVDNSECQHSQPGSIYQKDICWQDPATTAATCNGDIGSPVVDEATGEVVALVSTNIGAGTLPCVPDQPQFGPSIADYLSWISSNLVDVEDEKDEEGEGLAADDEEIEKITLSSIIPATVSAWLWFGCLIAVIFTAVIGVICYWFYTKPSKNANGNGNGNGRRHANKNTTDDENSPLIQVK